MNEEIENYFQVRVDSFQKNEKTNELVVKITVTSVELMWNVYRRWKEFIKYLISLQKLTTTRSILLKDWSEEVVLESKEKIDYLQTLINVLFSNECVQREIEKSQFFFESFQPVYSLVSVLHEGSMKFCDCLVQDNLQFTPSHLVLSQNYHLYFYLTTDEFSFPVIDISLPIHSCVYVHSSPTNIFLSIDTKTMFILQMANYIEAEWWSKLIARFPSSKSKIPSPIKKVFESISSVSHNIFAECCNECNPHKKKQLKQEIKQTIQNKNVITAIKKLKTKNVVDNVGEFVELSVQAIMGTNLESVQTTLNSSVCLTINNVIVTENRKLKDLEMKETDFISLQAVNKEMKMILSASALHEEELKEMKEKESKNNDNKINTQIIKTNQINEKEGIICNSKEKTLNNNLNCYPNEHLVKIYSGILHLHLQYKAGPPVTCIGLKFIAGSLIITSARIIFRVEQGDYDNQEDDGLFSSPRRVCSEEGFEIPIPLFYEIKKEKVLLPSIGNYCCVLVKCKNFHQFSLAFFDGNKADELEDIIMKAVGRGRIHEMFYFRGNYESPIYYDKELERLEWNKSGMNLVRIDVKGYPNKVIVPIANEEEINQVIGFRSKGRIPAATWWNREKGVIMRSSQPLVGLKTSRCFSDEKLLEKAAELSKNKRISIIDCRPKLNASANLIKGMGFEDIKYYKNSEIIFLDIDNIHKMRESFLELTSVTKKISYCNVGATDGMKMVTSSKWLYHINKILKGTYLTTNKFLNGNSLLIHCSDGWDRTSQIVSLVEIIVDPYYRTIEGLEALIDKDWIAFGHKFQDRCRHFVSTQSINEYSPIFLQFIDCVYQFMRIFPKEFEFNETFLIEIIQQTYSCYFGNFLFNCVEPINPRPESLWDVLNNKEIQCRFVNPSYHPSTTILNLSFLEKQTPLLWRKYYLQYHKFHSL
ncbi:hypothetical protein, conserved [Entamoeba dispar SAW760]|uniref:Myotubularin phosphatase domain-containing protein n=1 Tax=Entamoeba dispar (strain ATCC PRA-260 / SAW760) TaxID=370354 RepID=B0ENC0_ENTDS|nr:uncharacterized protein EDI_187250 [Entamoeba dispar SAW760]EDR23997.1 hypothetical protein, conserved [Entamoeba dispar SAW760]|eukprot:EDR23997.1 hypothetical protein, conserved [Entamoeba dispar SAW760]